MAIEQECRHFIGVGAHTCRAGVRYMDVRTEESPCRHPCYDSEVHTCAKRDWLTASELQAKENEINAAVAQMVERSNSGLCIVCGQSVERMQQVGGSIYAEPCGHRNGRGSARYWQKRMDERKGEEGGAK